MGTAIVALGILLPERSIKSFLDIRKPASLRTAPSIASFPGRQACFKQSKKRS
jgi:hypothetical protein